MEKFGITRLRKDVFNIVHENILQNQLSNLSITALMKLNVGSTLRYNVNIAKSLYASI